MADGYGLDLQKGLRAALVADAGVYALVGARVYDKAPEGATYPLIMFGGVEVSPEDTDGTLASYVSVSLEVHSRSVAGSVEAGQIIEAIRAALHRSESSVTLAAHTLVELVEQTSRIARNADGKSYTGVAVYRAYIDS